MVSYYHWGKLFHQIFVLKQHALIFPLELSLITGIVGKKNINRCKVGKGFTARGINSFTNKP